MGRSAVATVAWLATDHQQLMYLLSPEGKTVFYIPGGEVVHKVSTPINLPEESNKVKMEPGKMQPPPGGSRKRAAGLSLDLNSALAKRNKPCTPKALRRLSSTCANLSHPAQTIWRLQTPLTCTRAYQRRNRTKGFPSLCKPLPILDLLQGRRGLTTLRPTKCRMESRLRTSLMII